MITKTNQTKIYKNEVIRDAIRLIRQGESAFVYSKILKKVITLFRFN